MLTISSIASYVKRDIRHTPPTAVFVMRAGHMCPARITKRRASEASGGDEVAARGGDGERHPPGGVAQTEVVEGDVGPGGDRARTSVTPRLERARFRQPAPALPEHVCGH